MGDGRSGRRAWVVFSINGGFSIRGGFVRQFFARGLELLEVFEGPVVGAREGSFVADDEGEAGAGVGEVAEDPGEAEIVVEIGVGAVDLFFAVGKLEVEERSFEGRDAKEPPAGEG